MHPMRVFILLCIAVLSTGKIVHMEEDMDMCVMSASRVLRLAISEPVLSKTAFEWGEQHAIVGWQYERHSDAAARNLAIVRRSKRLQLALPLECARVRYSVFVYMPRFAVTYLGLKDSKLAIDKELCTADGMLFERVIISGIPLLHSVTIASTATFEAGEMHTTTTTDLRIPLILSIFHNHVAGVVKERWRKKNKVFVAQMCARRSSRPISAATREVPQ